MSRPSVSLHWCPTIIGIDVTIIIIIVVVVIGGGRQSFNTLHGTPTSRTAHTSAASFSSYSYFIITIRIIIRISFIHNYIIEYGSNYYYS
jgi:hypothetical protein